MAGHPGRLVAADGGPVVAEGSAAESSAAAVPGPVPAAGGVSLSSRLADLCELTKPRIVSMVLVTTLIAALIAGGGLVPPLLLLHLIVGVGLVAGSAGAMNQVWERRRDGLMERTCQRPLAAGRLTAVVGAGMAVTLGLLGTIYLWIMIGAVASLLALATWLLYVPIYTPLKVVSSWNTTVGAISGALPMMIGYTAGGGRLGDGTGWLLVGVLVAWQYPHFMAIAWLVRHQYARAGFRMATTEDPSGCRAGRQSVFGMLALVGCLIALAVIVTSSIVSAGLVVMLALAVTWPMLTAAWRFAAWPDETTARRLLRASLLQLPASLTLVTLAALCSRALGG